VPRGPAEVGRYTDSPLSDAEHTVVVKREVVTDHGLAFGLRLGDQYAVEGVLEKAWERGCTNGFLVPQTALGKTRFDLS
jgi:hypothetical protein